MQLLIRDQIKVGLVQINNSFSGQDYFPYSVGMLQAYAQKNSTDPKRYEFLLPIHRRIRVDEALERLESAQVVGFSAYVWNFRISLEIAQRLKKKSPNTLIVFGGPHVPDRAEMFLRQYPFIDICCHGEGEQVFLQILENFPSTDFTSISSISYLDKDGQFRTNPKIQRLRDLMSIPSPYLEGIFIPLIEANPKAQWLALWETNRGCPFSCTFCDWGSSTQSKVAQFEMQRLFREVEWFAEHEIEFVFCCDANFGMLNRDLELTQYIADIKRKTGYPKALSVQNTKNATERAYLVQKILSDGGLNKGVTLSLQSVDPTTLKNIKRQNISTETYRELQRRFMRDRIETYTDLILGLPGETYDSFVEGVSKVVEEGQHNRIQFNNLSILPNAEMGDPEYQKKFGMVTVESKIINIHGSLLDSDNEVYEIQQLVIATDSMPRQDWVRTRAFCWMAALLHFDKILQIPLILLHELTGVSYRELFETFTKGDLTKYPILSEIRSFFEDEARKIQNGGPEYVRSEQWLNIWWPADEYIFIKLSVEGQLDSFYSEAELLLANFLKEKNIDLPWKLLEEAVLLNQKLIKQPFQTEDLDIEITYNLLEFYTARVRGDSIPLKETPSFYHIDRTSETWNSWDEWCKQVVWYGNKKGAYLYGHRAMHRELAGHF